MDDVDLAILSRLQDDARCPNTELARELGLAASTVLERIRKLEARGVIQGYRAIIAPEAVGLGTQALVTATMALDQIDAIHGFHDAVAGIPHVRSCYGITGRYDYLLHVLARDMGHLREMLHTRINPLRGLGKTETFVVMGEVKPDSGVPLEESLLDSR